MLIETQWYVNSGKLMTGMKPGHLYGQKRRIGPKSRYLRGGGGQERDSVVRKARETLHFLFTDSTNIFFNVR